MLITGIKKTGKHLCEITLEGKTVKIDNDIVLEQALKKGDEISEKRLEQLITLSENKRALSRSVWYIERGDLSKKALCDKLKRAGFCAGAIDYATARMQELGLINDSDYAARLAERLLSDSVSRREAVIKMQNKGFSFSQAKEALEMFECDETEQIKALIIKKYKTKLTDEESVRKVFAALQRKGFSYSNIKTVLNQYSELLRYSEENNGI